MQRESRFQLTFQRYSNKIYVTKTQTCKMVVQHDELTTK